MALLLIQGLCSVKYNTGDKSCGLSKVFCFEYGCTLHCKYKKEKLRAVFLLLMAKEESPRLTLSLIELVMRSSSGLRSCMQYPICKDQKQYPVIPNFQASFEVKGETRWSMLTFTLHPSHIGGRWTLEKKQSSRTETNGYNDEEKHSLSSVQSPSSGTPTQATAWFGWIMLLQQLITTCREISFAMSYL